MRRGSRLVTLLFAVVAVAYLVRAAEGLVAGISNARGELAYDAGRYEEARAHLVTAAVGFNRYNARWLAAEAALGVADAAEGQAGRREIWMSALRSAGENYLRAALDAPAAAWPWAGLATVYARIEREDRGRRTHELARLDQPWARVGRAGRIAIGLTRRAIEREPATTPHRDQLARIFDTLGLEREARGAVRDAARIQPNLDFHRALRPESLRPDLLEAFFQGAIESEGKTPFLDPTSRRISVGILARRLGRNRDAEQLLRDALRGPADSVQRAEAAFHLGSVLVETGRTVEGTSLLERAAEYPAFRLGVAMVLARAAERESRWSDALARMQQARRERPRDVGLCLEVARLARAAGRPDEAIEALTWAEIVSPGDARVLETLAVAYRESGDAGRADRVLEKLSSLPGGRAIVDRLRNEPPSRLPTISDRDGRSGSVPPGPSGN